MMTETLYHILCYTYNMLHRLKVLFMFLFQAKQRATVKWLLSKAFNNRVPENLKEPFYRDHEVCKMKIKLNTYCIPSIIEISV